MKKGRGYWWQRAGRAVRKLVKFVMRVLDKAEQDRTSAYAAQVAFYILMSVFPFAILVLQFIRVAPVSQESMLYAVDSIFPEYLLTTLHGILQEIYSGSFGLVPLTVIAMLWTTSKVMHALVQGLDAICSTERSRSWLAVRAWSVVFTMIFALMVVLLAGSMVVWQPIRGFLVRCRPRGVSLSTYIAFIRTIYTVLVGTLVLAALYKVLPRRKLRFTAQFPGALLAALGIYILSVGIAVYVGQFNGFSAYGSLTTLTLIMFLLYFSCYFIMLGAVVNEVLRRGRDNLPLTYDLSPTSETSQSRASSAAGS
jgi:membrane protein